MEQNEVLGNDPRKNAVKGKEKGKNPIEKPEAVVTAQEQESGVVVDPTKTYVFESLGDASRSKYWGLSNVCEVFDPAVGRRRKMRYVPHFDSIWLDEQPADEHVSQTDYSITFFSGKKQVSGIDKMAVLYMLNHDRIEGRLNPISTRGPLFRLSNPDAIAKKKIERSEKESDALLKALELKDNTEELNMISFVLFGQTFDSESVALQQVVDWAKKSPSAFLDLCDDPRTRRKYLIRQGLDKGIIKEKFSMLKWGLSESDIVQLPPNKDILTFVTDWSFSDEGKDFTEVLKRQLAR